MCGEGLICRFSSDFLKSTPLSPSCWLILPHRSLAIGSSAQRGMPNFPWPSHPIHGSPCSCPAHRISARGVCIMRRYSAKEGGGARCLPSATATLHLTCTPRSHPCSLLGIPPFRIRICCSGSRTSRRPVHRTQLLHPATTTHVARHR